MFASDSTDKTDFCYQRKTRKDEKLSVKSAKSDVEEQYERKYRVMNMKARLAKKIAHTPIDRLAPRWRNRFTRHDVQIEKALRMWHKRRQQQK